MIETEFRPFGYTIVAYKKMIKAAHGLNVKTQPDPNALQAITTNETTPCRPLPPGNDDYDLSFDPEQLALRIITPSLEVVVVEDPAVKVPKQVALFILDARLVVCLLLLPCLILDVRMDVRMDVRIDVWEIHL
ncbi:Serine/threonine kinase [Fusarium falciforme]|uniref:Serine/threonine kinase n=1 Tax=Fusarium falciforme TaxID=195108 RepID=A0A9W8QUC0_9HYPO|nr:Serine/threonine kinase [Fusarium falciforme]